MQLRGTPRLRTGPDLASEPRMFRLLPIPLVVIAVGACSRAGSRDEGSDAAISPPIGNPDAAVDVGPGPAAACFAGIGNPDPNVPKPNYDQFSPIVGSHCAGTDHQTITGVEKVVFLGDSITEGTPPTAPWEYYRERLAAKLRQQFGGSIGVSECAAWGARADDLLMPPHQQVHECFPGPEPNKTLIVMTIGGNDMNSILEDAQNGDTPEQTMAKADAMLALFEDTVRYLKDPVNFPAGSYVVFANIYEFTDGTGEIESCPGAALAGFSGMAPPQMRPAYIRVDEQYMRIAVETGSDMIFLLESFCGHGFHAGFPANECYRGPDAETWFDFTCIHPNPAGHAAMAELFAKTIME
jgi:lysophospholipase L1-like esterase